MKKPRPWKPDGPFTLPIPRCGVCNCKALEVKRSRKALTFKCWACGVTDRLTIEDMETPRLQEPGKLERLLVKMGTHLERGKRGSKIIHYNPSWALPVPLGTKLRVGGG